MLLEYFKADRVARAFNDYCYRMVDTKFDWDIYCICT